MSFFRNVFGRNSDVEQIDLTKRFDLLAPVGQGSMSKVWRARDSRTGQLVAVKVLDLDKTERHEMRFQGLDKPSEGECAVLFRHPHIVRTLEHGLTLQGEQFLVMEFLEGIGLSFLIDMQNEVMREHRIRLIVELGEAISYLHKNDFIHRDICPRNVLLDRENRIKLIDFGLMVPNLPDFRKPGNRTGTANYMAPELIRRQQTDERLDIFSFSVTCFEMFTKQMPWGNPRGQESLDAVTKRINSAPRHIQELVPDIDPIVARSIMKGLEMRPEDRWKSIDQMIEPLQDLIDDGYESIDDDDDEFEEVDEYEEVGGGDTPPPKARTRRSSEDDGYEDITAFVEKSLKNRASNPVVEDDDDDEWEDVDEYEEV